MSRSPWLVLNQALGGGFPAEGDRFAPDVLSGMTPEELEQHKSAFPGGLPLEIAELLLHIRGFGFSELGEIRFDRKPENPPGFLIPGAIRLCGNHQALAWYQTIHPDTGSWDAIWVVDHARRAMAVQAENLSEFLSQLFNTVEHRINWLDHIRNRVLPALAQSPPAASGPPRGPARRVVV